jgi:hypothetical protein
VGLVTLKEKLIVLRRLENELRSIRQRIDNEENPARKAKMIDVHSKMSIALTGKEL